MTAARALEQASALAPVSAEGRGGAPHRAVRPDLPSGTATSPQSRADGATTVMPRHHETPGELGS